MKKMIISLSVSAMLLGGTLPFLTQAATAAPAVSFKDITNHWAKSSILSAAQMGMIGGFTDGTFKPNATISRSEFSAILSRLLKLEENTTTPFNDLNSNWAKGYIGALIQAGVILPNEYKGKYEPNKPITRLEISEMIGRALAMDPDYELYLNKFKNLYAGDLPVTDWKKIKEGELPLLALAYGAGVVGGLPDDSFGLDISATRAEATVMLLRLNSVKDKNPNDFLALKELKSVAERGTNYFAFEMKGFHQARDLVKDPIIIEHNKFKAKIKRYYVMPWNESGAKSIYEKKFIGDKSKAARADKFKDAEGYVVAIAELTANMDLNDYSLKNSLAMLDNGNPENKTLSMKFGYKDADANRGVDQAIKGKTQEWALYSRYSFSNEDLDDVVIQSNGATKGSKTSLFYANKPFGK